MSAAKNKTRTKDKYRVVYNDTQRIELENEFRVSEYISIPRKQEIAHKLKLSERQIKIWFQNRRAKKRKQDKRHKSSPEHNHHHHHIRSATATATGGVSLKKADSKKSAPISMQAPNAATGAPTAGWFQSTTDTTSTSTSTTAATATTATTATELHYGGQQGASMSPQNGCADPPPSYHLVNHHYPHNHYNYNCDYDANSNIVQTTNTNNNYCPENNHSPHLELAGATCQQSNPASNTTTTPDYIAYPPPNQPMLHQQPLAQNTTQSNSTNYYPANQQHHHHHLAQMNRASSTGIVHQTTNKLMNCDDDFLAEPRVSNVLSRSTQACYETMRPFGYHPYENPLHNSQYIEGEGGQPGRRPRSSSYNNLGSINSHHQTISNQTMAINHPNHHQQLYTTTTTPQATATEHMFVPTSQQFYN